MSSSSMNIKLKLKLTPTASAALLQQQVSNTTVIANNHQLPQALASATTAAQNTLHQRVDITQEQSVELTKILMSAFINSVAFLREMFSEDCFQSKFFNPEHPSMTYEQFKTESLALNPSQRKKMAKQGKMEWQVLVRGKNPGADKLLDWLELAAVDALEKQYLATLQLAFFCKEQMRSEHAVEVFTMSFSYEQSGVTSTVEFQQHQSTFAAARDKLHEVVTQLAKELQADVVLPPERRYVGMRLEYTDRCPEDYQPFGFADSNSTTLNLGGIIGKFGAGYHKATLSHYIDPVDDSAPLDAVDASAPLDAVDASAPFQYRISLPPNDQEALLKNYPKDLVGQPKWVLSAWVKFGSIPEWQIAEWEGGTPQYLRACNAAHSHVAKENTTNGGDHTSEANAMLDAGMIPHLAYLRKRNSKFEHIHLTEPLAQGAPKPKRWTRKTDAVRRAESQEIEQAKIVSSMATSRDNETGDTQLLDIQARQSQALASHALQAPMSSPLTRPTPLMTREVSQGVLDHLTKLSKCECKSQKEGLVMFRCHLCKHLKHIVCYGYIKKEELPVKPTCYTCLFGGTGKVIVAKVNKLIRYRNYSYLLYYTVGAYDNQYRIKDELNINQDKVDVMDLELKKHGFLIGSKPHYVLVDNAVQRAKLFTEYFDPTTDIAHFFEPSAASEANNRSGTGINAHTAVNAESTDAAIGTSPTSDIRGPQLAATAPSGNSGSDFVADQDRRKSSYAGGSTQGTSSTQASRLRSSPLAEPGYMSNSKVHTDGEDASSTEGTPSTRGSQSPRRVTRASGPSRDMSRSSGADALETPGPRIRLRVGKKRNSPQSDGDQGGSPNKPVAKRAKVGQANSPFMIHNSAEDRNFI